MPSRIEDYALIGNRETVALVARHGSIDWMGMPRFDSAACFAPLLGTPGHERWLVAPLEATTRVTRRYRGDTLILETDLPPGEGNTAHSLARAEGPAQQRSKGSVSPVPSAATRFA